MQNITESTLLLDGLQHLNGSLNLLTTTTLHSELNGTTSFEELLLQNTLALVSSANNRKAPSPNSLQNAEFSPVTLSPEWSRMSRLLLLSALGVLGSVGNIFMISSVVIEDYLKKPGKGLEWGYIFL